MFLLQLLIIAMAGVAIYKVAHRQARPAVGTADPTAAVSTQRAPFWPTTVEGTVALGAFVLNFAPIALVNVIQVPFLGWTMLVAALAFSGVARFVKHDGSTSVLGVFVLTAIGVVFSLLFLAGEVFIGHE
ncbi:MAG: hypothetical protein ACOYXM_06780 [Actinomycetota bacterium]